MIETISQTQLLSVDKVHVVHSGAVAGCCDLSCCDSLRLQKYQKDNAGVDLEII